MAWSQDQMAAIRLFPVTMNKSSGPLHPAPILGQTSIYNHLRVLDKRSPAHLRPPTILSPEMYPLTLYPVKHMHIAGSSEAQKTKAL